MSSSLEENVAIESVEGASKNEGKGNEHFMKRSSEMVFRVSMKVSDVVLSSLLSVVFSDLVMRPIQICMSRNVRPSEEQPRFVKWRKILRTALSRYNAIIREVGWTGRLQVSRTVFMILFSIQVVTKLWKDVMLV